MRMDTMGSLSGGRWVWGLGQLNGDRKLGRGDTLRNYTLLISPNVIGKSLIIKQLSMRMECLNMVTSALNRAKDTVFRMRHTKEFDADMREEAASVVAQASGLFEKFVARAEAMSSVGLSRDEQLRYLVDVFRLDPRSLEARREEDEEKVRRSPLLSKFDEALALAPGSQTDAARGTLWGAFNAVTWLCDHRLGRSYDVRLRESWLGYRENIKERALQLAEAYH